MSLYPSYNPVYPHSPQQLQMLPHLLVPEPPDAALNLKDIFGREAPLEIDVGCGKGRFLIARATKFPDRNILAIERKINRVKKVQNKINTTALSNVRMLRVEAAHAISRLIPDQRIAVCHIFFPDPWPKQRHNHRRLFSDTFQTALWQKLAVGGQINFATDHQDYFAQVQSKMENDPRFQRTETFVTADDEKSEFEQIFLNQGLSIGRCSFLKVCAEAC